MTQEETQQQHEAVGNGLIRMGLSGISKAGLLSDTQYSGLLLLPV